MPLSEQLLEILACPVCKGDLEYSQEPEYLRCPECKKRYPVRDGIPVMLVEEAESESE